MDQAVKRRGWPLPDAINMKPIAFNLEEALAVENMYRPNLLVILQDTQPEEVTIVARDGAVQILRFLRVWFDVSHSVFFTAVTYLDLFLSRIKVQRKYLNCLTMASFYCAVEKHRYNIDVGQLVMVSQSNCSMKDVLRMANIVKEKLRLETNDNDRTTTCADFLIIFLEILEYVSTHWGIRLRGSEVLQKEQLLTRLEVLLNDHTCGFFRSSVLALVLIKLELEKQLAQGIAARSMYFVGEVIQLTSIIRELQYTCQLKSAELVNCCNNASNVLKQYDNQDRIRHGHNLVGRYLPTTDKSSKYRYFQLLDTIEEKNQKSP